MAIIIIAVGEQSSLGGKGGRDESAQMYKTKYFQMYSVFTQKRSSLQFFPFRISVILKNNCPNNFKFARI